MEPIAVVQSRAGELYAIRLYQYDEMRPIFVAAWFLQHPNGRGTMMSFFLGVN